MSWASPIKAVRTYLDEAFIASGDSARTFGGVPSPRPDRFVRLMCVGTATTSLAHRDVRIVAECWETSESNAEAFGDTVSDLLASMDAASGHVPNGPAGWAGGPYSQPDPDSGTPRAVMTFILRQRRN